MGSDYVGWWNLENLFNEEDAPLLRRSDKVKRAIGTRSLPTTARRRLMMGRFGRGRRWRSRTGHCVITTWSATNAQEGKPDG